MRKMPTILLKLLTLFLVLTISLCSCAQISDILGLTPDEPGIEDNTPTDTPDDGETPPADTPDDTPAHTHNYVSEVTEPTCTAEGYTTFICECGKTFTASKTPVAPHSYADGVCTACGAEDPDFTTDENKVFDYSLVPEYTDSNYAEINGNIPYFTADEITSTSFESYSDLDSLGRVGVAFACLGRETLPTDGRGSLSYNPTGWVQNNYPTNIVSTTQIYNRSHLIAWSLAGENNNEKNLMTGTPYFNQVGMQIFESLVLDYIKETGNHVMYRVTPVFVDDNLLAQGVLMEGWSVEDNGEGICFCVFMYNVQPGIVLEYETGNNYAEKSDGATMGNSATLVTDISQIKAGDKIIIVSNTTNYAMGDVSSSGNNRVAVEIEKDGNTVYFGDEVAVITLGNGKTAGTYSLAVAGGYLYSASSSKNYLKTESTLTNNSSWSIAISGGVATIKSTGSYTRNWLRFNSSNVIFSVYGSGQQDICIYVVNE